MAIIGSASKAGRAGTYSGSSTDDDDLTVRQKPKPPKNALFLDSDVSDEADFAEKGTELCQLGDEICAVPIELFDLPGLNSILSLDSWNFCLSEDEREFLVSFLPALEEDDFKTTMRDLLGGQNFHFGSPLADLFNRLRGGLCAPKVARYNESLKYVQRKKHYHHLRNYHNQMVKNFLEMQKSWEDCPESADIDERLEIWSSWKAEKSNPPMVQLTPGSKKKGGSAKKPKVMPIVSKKVVIPEERRVVVSPVPVPIPITPANSRGGSKGVLKMKVIAPKAVQGGGSKTGPERELERVHVPAPKGVLKVASKGVQGHAKPDPTLREKAVILEPKRETVVREVKPAKVVKTAKPVKDLEVVDQSRTLLKPMSEKKKRSLGGDRKRKKRLDDQEIFAAKQDEPQTVYVGETPPHEVHQRKRTPPQENRKKVKSFTKTFHLAYEEAQDHEEERILEEERKPSFVKKKVHRKKPSEEPKKKVVEIMNEDDDFEQIEDRRILSESRQDDFQNSREHIDFRDDEVLKIPKKKSKKKAKETKREASPRETTPEDSAGERGASVKSSKKLSTLSVPSIASTFSFSVSHLLSAVRMALTLPCGDITSEFHNQNGAPDGAFGYEKVFLGHYDDLSLEQSDHSPGVFGDGVSHLVDDIDIEGQRSPGLSSVFEDDLPNLVGVPDLDGEGRSQGITLAEIVLMVQNNPGDVRILETDEPLSNLVRGALKVFSSKTAPPGAKGWKPLAKFDKVSRKWSWVGPVLLASFFDSPHEVLVTAEAWGVPQKTLTKMEEAFAVWLKHGRETLQQIVQLPLPPTPPALMISLDEKERFRDLRAQKSLMTITASSDDMRAYFQKEEILRYSLPDRAFSYTTADGRKSVVAPLRRGGGKPTSKARDHFMLKPDRPPHVTILCLVRDAAARLPGSVGTRADVCTLIHDSQYIVDDVSDLQVNQVVSGALDRLHYERDPCVKFDGERKLWMYLHTERQEEDFEEDGTSSTKRWKKPRKESSEHGELGLLGYDNGSPSGADQEGFERGIGVEMNSSDETGESGNPSAIYSVGRTKLVYCKGGSLSSPRVLVSVMSNSVREESSVSFLEIPSSLHPNCVDPRNTHSVAWGRVGPTAAWISDHHHLHLIEPLGEEDCETEPAAAAQRDADAMIDTDTD